MEDAVAVFAAWLIRGDENMLDIIFIVVTALFFALGVVYVRGCERLKRDEHMNSGNAHLLVICALIWGYLLYALLKAEEF